VDRQAQREAMKSSSKKLEKAREQKCEEMKRYRTKQKAASTVTEELKNTKKTEQGKKVTQLMKAKESRRHKQIRDKEENLEKKAAVVRPGRWRLRLKLIDKRNKENHNSDGEEIVSESTSAFCSRSAEYRTASTMLDNDHLMNFFNII
jgi:hypothetical protein